MKRPKGRPKVGPPVCISLMPDQRLWLEARVPPGGSLSAVVRALVQAEMERPAAPPPPRREQEGAA